MNKKIVTYPRGFLGFDIGIPIETKGDSTKQMLINASYNRTGNQLRFVISNKTVETLWKQLSDGVAFVNSPEIREKIITNALGAFGSESFYEWVMLQNANPSMTDMHRRFLNDTLNYIETGNRAMSINSWTNVIEVRDVTSKDAHPALNYDKFFGTTMPLHHRRFSTMIDVIVAWLSHENGFEDLCGSLHIFFGDIES